MPYSATSAAATSSLVDSGFEAARYDLGAAGLERPHQVRGLGRDVEARADAQPVERPLALEALADEAQDGHLPLRPLDAADALGREAEIGDVVRREAVWPLAASPESVQGRSVGRSPCG